jgi:hypothetical protein
MISHLPTVGILPASRGRVALRITYRRERPA